MRCEDSEHALTQRPVVDMLARYRKLLAERGANWEGELEEDATHALLRAGVFCEITQLTAASAAHAESRNPNDAMRLLLDTLPDPLPIGHAIARPSGIEVRSPLPYVIGGQDLTYVVVFPATATDPSHVVEATVTAKNPYLEVDGHREQAAEPVPGRRLRPEAGNRN